MPGKSRAKAKSKKQVRHMFAKAGRGEVPKGLAKEFGRSLKAQVAKGKKVPETKSGPPKKVVKKKTSKKKVTKKKTARRR